MIIFRLREPIRNPMEQRHPSDSSEQQLAQKEILALLNQTHNLNLISKKILVDDALY